MGHRKAADGKGTHEGPGGKDGGRGVWRCEEGVEGKIHSYVRSLAQRTQAPGGAIGPSPSSETASMPK